MKNKKKKTSKIKEILKNGSLQDKKALFQFTMTDPIATIKLKFNLWSRFFLIKYFTSKDAPFHSEIDESNIKAYKYDLDSFLDIAFRGGAKTARTKLFMAFVILNDEEHFRKFIKVLSSDTKNSKQIVTDVYNILVNPHIVEMYPEVFTKTEKKREETMTSFTTSTGVKMLAGVVGVEQRGSFQEASRPDLIWFEDFESRATLRSAVKTISIWDNMEEARTGLSNDGSCIYTCNYISEQGNVNKLVQKESERKKVLIVPIIDDEGILAWPEMYSKADVARMKNDDDDFEGERLCKPSAGKDVMFDRKKLEEMKAIEPIENVSGFKIYRKYLPGNRYASGHDVAGGVSLDSSTSVFIDFSTVPASVVATFNSNTIKPESFGYEVYNENNQYGKCLCAVENNYGTEAILILKQKEVNLYKTQKKNTAINNSSPTEYG